jgi:hypothetical protein
MLLAIQKILKLLSDYIGSYTFLVIKILEMLSDISSHVATGDVTSKFSMKNFVLLPHVATKLSASLALCISDVES